MFMNTEAMDLIVDNIMKPLKAGLSTAANKAARAVVKKFTKGVKAGSKVSDSKGNKGTGKIW